MPLIYATDPTFQQQYPNGATVRDRLGQVLKGVEACDPVTGEVISIVGLDGTTPSDTPDELLPAMDGQLQRRRRFHPAPLSIEPRQWLHVGMD
jgi:hypothetical protein